MHRKTSSKSNENGQKFHINFVENTYKIKKQQQTSANYLTLLYNIHSFYIVFHKNSYWKAVWDEYGWKYNIDVCICILPAYKLSKHFLSFWSSGPGCMKGG